MKLSFTKSRILFAVIVALSATFVVVRSEVRAAISSGLHQVFGLVSIDGFMTKGSWDLPLTQTNSRFQPISLTDAQKQVSFHIPLPTWLPTGTVQDGADVYSTLTSKSAPQPKTVVILYSLPDRPIGTPQSGLSIEITEGAKNGGHLYPAERAEKASINGIPAVYVRGAFDDKMEWHSDAEWGVLSWAHNGFTFTLTGQGTLSKLDILIKIAGSLQ